MSRMLEILRREPRPLDSELERAILGRDRTPEEREIDQRLHAERWLRWALRQGGFGDQAEA